MSVETAKESGVYVMDAVINLNARPAALRYVISRLCEYRSMVDYLAYCRVFKADGNKSWSYAVVDPPVLNPRDYVIVSEIEQELNPDGTGTYRSTWKLAPDQGPAPRPGVLRLRYNEGSWTLTTKGMNDGKRTQLRYQVRLSPGGVIPGWVAGYVAKRTLPSNMRLLEQTAQEEDQRGHVIMPVPGAPWANVPIKPLDNPLPPISNRPPPLFGGTF